MKTVDPTRRIGETVHSPKTPGEYWELMSAEINGLYLFSFLLTADTKQAEQCLAEALDEFMDGLDDFLGWARIEGRQVVLRYAIQAIRPRPEIMQDWMDFGLSGSEYALDCQRFGAITSLRPFERFVFVMTNIEGQFDSECAKLLAATELEVGIARKLAERILLIGDCGFNHSIRQSPKHMLA